MEYPNQSTQAVITFTDIERIMELTLRYKEIPPDRILLGSYRDINPSDRPHIAEQLRLSTLLGRKLPSWHKAKAFIPSGLNLEQCSSEATANFKANLLVHADDRLLDLTGGLGVDFCAMARFASSGVYIEAQETLVETIRYNLPRVIAEQSFSCTILQGEALGLLPSLLDQFDPTLIYLDPARRDEKDKLQRVYAIEDCTPSLAKVLELVLASEKRPRIAVKLSPMLDIKHTLLAYPNISCVQIIALRGEVKELILLFDPSQTYATVNEIPITATDITVHGVRSFTSSIKEDRNHITQYVSALGRYIYEPNAAIMKSGLYSSVAVRYGLSTLHPHTHLYTSEELCCNFVGHSFELVEIIPFQSSIIKGLAKRIPEAEISCRNFPLRPEALRSKLRIASGGLYTIMATTLANDSHVLLLLRRLP